MRVHLAGPGLGSHQRPPASGTSGPDVVTPDLAHTRRCCSLTLPLAISDSHQLVARGSASGSACDIRTCRQSRARADERTHTDLIRACRPGLTATTQTQTRQVCVIASDEDAAKCRASVTLGFGSSCGVRLGHPCESLFSDGLTGTFEKWCVRSHAAFPVGVPLRISLSGVGWSLSGNKPGQGRLGLLPARWGAVSPRS